MKFVQLAKSLKEELFPVYLIEGEEAYFRDRAVESIRAACKISQPALNEMRFEGENLKGDRLSAFLADLNTAPFFDDKRLVRVYDFYPAERDWEQLQTYLQDPCPTTVLLLVNRLHAGGEKKGVDLRRKKGLCFVDCAKEGEEALSPWLFRLFRKMGLEADGDVVTCMVRYCNFDAARLRSEAEKLALLLGEGGKVTQKVVEENVAKDLEYRTYELTQAASHKNFAAFSEILHDLMEKGLDEYGALAILASHYRTLCEISSMRGSDAQVASVLGIKPYAVQKNRETAARLGAEKVKTLYTEIYALGCDARAGLRTKSGALTAATAKIFFS